MKKPNLFIIGAPKCGTTSLHEYLADHPQVFMSTPKEPFHFDRDLPSRDSITAESDYLRLFDGADERHLVVGEASANYLYSKVAVPDILAFNPDARFIAMVRNPIDMAISLHGYQFQHMIEEDVADFQTAWRLQEERKAGRSLPKSNNHPDFVLYGPFCRVGEQLERLYSRVAKDRTHVIVFDDLCKDPLAVYRGVLAFLGLADDGRDSFPVRNVARAPQSLAYHKALGSLYALRLLLPVPRLGIGLFDKLRKRNLGPAARKEIAADFRRELAQYFSSDVELLSRLLNRDLTPWLQPKVADATAPA